MADRQYGDVVAGATSVSVPILLRSRLNNNPVTGMLASALRASYFREGDATPTPITLVALSARNAPWQIGGWFEIDAATMPGWYRFDVPSAAWSVGADWVAVVVAETAATPTTFGFDTVYRLQSPALIPDQLFKRDFAAVELSSPTARRSMLNAIRLLLNRWVTTPTTITVMKEDDVTTAWTGSLSTATGAAQITSVDPA